MPVCHAARNHEKVVHTDCVRLRSFQSVRECPPKQWPAATMHEATRTLAGVCTLYTQLRSMWKKMRTVGVILHHQCASYSQSILADPRTFNNKNYKCPWVKEILSITYTHKHYICIWNVSLLTPEVRNNNNKKKYMSGNIKRNLNQHVHNPSQGYLYVRFVIR